jgi:hypothetical protein
LRAPGDGPVRIFTVTGTPWGATAATTASTIAIARGSSAISAEPEATSQTFLAGHPMLMSITCAPRSTLNRAACAIIAGSAPASCTARGSGSPAWSRRREVFTVAHSRGLDAAISDTA